MSHDVFISHSSLDKLAANAVCHGLEASGIRCWIAPRDQIAGRPYGEQITSAIETAQVVVLVFSDNVNRSQAVLNEINIAATANRTIVPFRLTGVDFNSELHFYLGRMHWLDAFPQPIEAYIDALVSTVRRNLNGEPAQPAAAAPPSQPTPSEPLPAPREPVPAPPVAPPPAPPTPAPALPASPAQSTAAAPAAQAPAAAPAAPKTDMRPLAILGAVVGVVTLIVLVVALSPHPTPAPLSPAANAIESAVVNNVVANINDGERPDAGVNATATANAAGNATDGLASAAGAQPGRGDGAELTPVSAANPAMVSYYETQVAPNGPPQFLAGATVINTQQLLSSMRDRDAGGGPFWLIDARGCGLATIPTAACLGVNNIAELEAKVPNRQTQLVFFCLDGGCPMSYQAASAALAAGYSNVFWYRGGVSAWAAAGEPVAPAAGATL
jgi:rhodanese-related sulfurtransferase